MVATTFSQSQYLRDLVADACGTVNLDVDACIVADLVVEGNGVAVLGVAPGGVLDDRPSAGNVRPCRRVHAARGVFTPTPLAPVYLGAISLPTRVESAASTTATLSTVLL